MRTTFISLSRIFMNICLNAQDRAVDEGHAL